MAGRRITSYNVCYTKLLRYDMAFEWTADLSINVGDIDRQHQEIFVRYNAFIDACKEGEGKADLSDLLEFLTAYVNEHFEHEEKFMRDYKYPGKITHVKEHKELIQTVQKFKTRLALNGATVSLITELNP